MVHIKWRGLWLARVIVALRGVSLVANVSPGLADAGFASIVGSRWANPDGATGGGVAGSPESAAPRA